MLGGLMVQSCFEEGFFTFEVEVFVFERLRVVQKHTMEQCEVSNGSPEIVGIV